MTGFGVEGLKKAIGYVAAVVLIVGVGGGVALCLGLSLTTAIFEWPISEPSAVNGARAVWSLFVVICSIILLWLASILWGPFGDLDGES